MPTSSSASISMEFTAASGVRVRIPEWRSVLDGIKFSVDGEGGALVLPVPLPGMEEQMVLAAFPEGPEPVNQPEVLSLELVVASGPETMSMAMVIGYGGHDAVLRGKPGIAVYMPLDLGIPAVRSSVAKLAEQPSVLILVVHPRSGELLLELRLAHVELRESLRRVLADSVGVRAMDRAETLRVYADFSGTPPS